MQPVPPQPPSVIVVSADYVPAHRIVRTIGVVWGLTVRSQDWAGNIAAGLRSLSGGEVTEYTQLLDQARHEAMARLIWHAQSVGANAILGTRFDSSDLGGRGAAFTEILAYGTAVVVAPDGTASQPVSLR
jgi:uncharacterized protein YbjQ (UPF0145 family)